MERRPNIQIETFININYFNQQQELKARPLRKVSSDSFSKLRDSQIVCETDRHSEKSTASDDFELIDANAAKQID